jgi:hypothetical protein
MPDPSQVNIDRTHPGRWTITFRGLAQAFDLSTPTRTRDAPSFAKQRAGAKMLASRNGFGIVQATLPGASSFLTFPRQPEVRGFQFRGSRLPWKHAITKIRRSCISKISPYGKRRTPIRLSPR